MGCCLSLSFFFVEYYRMPNYESATMKHSIFLSLGTDIAISENIYLQFRQFYLVDIYQQILKLT